MTTPVVGVLALQGCVEPHKKHLEAAGAFFLPVKTPDDFAMVDALILPGGESTTMLKLIQIFGLKNSLVREFAAKPVWGVCAGAILMAREVTNPSQASFSLLPMTVRRNAYGRQNDSAVRSVDGYPVSFIRAPIFEDVGPEVEIVAELDSRPVWVESSQYMATSFHAELSSQTPSPMHKHFVQKIFSSKT